MQSMKQLQTGPSRVETQNRKPKVWLLQNGEVYSKNDDFCGTLKKAKFHNHTIMEHTGPQVR